MPSEMSIGERLLARLRGRGPGNTARPEPTPQLVTAEAARIARQQNGSISSGRAVGSEIFGSMESGLVFTPGDSTEEQASDIAVDLTVDSVEEGMAAANAAQQRRMLMYPLMLFMMMPLWPWAYAYGGKPLVSPERAASWGQKAQKYGSGAAKRWAKGRLSTHFEEYHKERAKSAAEAERLRQEHYEQAYRTGYSHYHGKSADDAHSTRPGQGRKDSSGGAARGTGASGTNRHSSNSEWERAQRRMKEQARQRAQQYYRAQKQKREQARRDMAGTNLLGFSGSMGAVSEAELRSAWRATATRLHPDMNPPEDAAVYAEKFASARAAYEETCRQRGITP